MSLEYKHNFSVDISRESGHPDITEYGSLSVEERNRRAYEESVEEYIKELYPVNTAEASFDQPVPITDPRSLELEHRIGLQFISDILPKYGIPQEVVDSIVEVEGDGIQAWELPVPKDYDIPTLPEEYAYSGGVARAGLLRALHIDNQAGFRDMDIVRLGGSKDKTPFDKKLEGQYMAEDSAHGYGVQQYPDMDAYLKTRDITLSELLLDKNGIVFTPQCLLDTARGIVRLSDFERNALRAASPKTKVLAKAVRIYAQGITDYGSFHLDTEITRKMNERFILIFYQALHFTRAVEHSAEAALEYINVLRANNAIPSEVTSVEQCAAYYAARLRDKAAFFRNTPHMQWLFEQDLLAKTSAELESALHNSSRWDSMEYGALDVENPDQKHLAVLAAKKHLEIDPATVQDTLTQEEEDKAELFDDFADSGRKRYKLR